MVPSKSPGPALAALAAARGLPLGPYAALLSHCGIPDPEIWLVAGQRLLPLLEALPGDASLRWGLWLPLFSRVVQLLGRGERLVLGINGPIGAGKSTMMAALVRLAAEHQWPLAVASIDDAYLDWDRRQTLLAGNPFGVWRGPPGSHDVALLLERIDHWRSGGELVLPRFDKRLRGGQGDRCGAWHGRPQLLLLEGWLLGCRPLPPDQLSAALLQPPLQLGLREAELAWLPIWNRQLEAYGALWSQLEGLWLLRPTHWNWPRRWRYQAEARQRRSTCGGPAQALPIQELEQLVRACLLALPPQLYQDPLTLDSRSEALVLLDGRRRCRWSGPASWFESSGSTVQPSQRPGTQPSSSPPSSATG